MANDDCFEKAKLAAGDALSDAQVKAIYNDAVRQAKSASALKNVGNAEAVWKQSLLDSTKSDTVAQLRQRLLARMDTYRRDTTENKIRESKSWAQGLRALLAGSEKSKEDYRNSVDARARASHAKKQGDFEALLKKNGIREVASRGALDDETTRDLMTRDKPQGEAINPTSKKYGDIIKATLAHIRNLYNAEGANIKDNADYVVPPMWDPASVAKMGRNKFVSMMMDHVQRGNLVVRGLEKAAPEQLKEALEESWAGMASGKHISGIDLGDDGPLQGMLGQGNKARSASQVKKFLFKDPTAFLDTFRKIGFGSSTGKATLFHALSAYIEKSTRDIELMRAFGSQPELGYQSIKENLMRDALKSAEKESDLAEFNQLKGTFVKASLDDLYKEVSGQTRVPANVTAARIGSNIRSFVMLSKLGFAPTAHLSTLATVPAELRFQGLGAGEALGQHLMNMLGSTKDSILGFFKGEGDMNAKKEALMGLNIGLKSQLGDTWNAVGGVDGARHGLLTRAVEAFMKGTGLTKLLEFNRESIGTIMMKQLGDFKDTKFSDLPDATKNVFKLYGLNEPHWDAMRQHAVEIDGNHYVTPDLTRQIPDEHIGQMLQSEGKNATAQNILRERDDQQIRWNTMFLDRADHGVLFPGAAEKALVSRGQQPGTWTRELAELMWQFKKFPLTVLQKGLGREVYGRGSDTLREALTDGKGAVGGLAHFLASTFVMGGIITQLNDYLRGQGTIDLSTPAHAFKAALRFAGKGGGLGLAGDILFNDYGDGARSAANFLLGPTLGDAAQAVTLASQARQGQDVKSKLTDLAASNVPGFNAWMLQWLLHSQVVNRIKEMLNPGSVDRAIQRHEKLTGQKPLLGAKRQPDY